MKVHLELDTALPGDARLLGLIFGTAPQPDGSAKPEAPPAALAWAPDPKDVDRLTALWKSKSTMSVADRLRAILPEIRKVLPGPLPLTEEQALARADQHFFLDRPPGPDRDGIHSILRRLAPSCTILPAPPAPENRPVLPS